MDFHSTLVHPYIIIKFLEVSLLTFNFLITSTVTEYMLPEF